LRLRKLREKIIFYNEEANRNLKFEAKIYFSLKDFLFNLDNFEFKFKIASRRRKKLNDKNTFVNNRVNESILKHLIKNRVNKIKFISVKS